MNFAFSGYLKMNAFKRIPNSSTCYIQSKTYVDFSYCVFVYSQYFWYSNGQKIKYEIMKRVSINVINDVNVQLFQYYFTKITIKKMCSINMESLQISFNIFLFLILFISVSIFVFFCIFFLILFW